MSSKLLELADLHHHYFQGGEKIEVLSGAELALRAGQVTCLVGPSGCGKSTLLHIAGLLEKPISGKIRLEAEDVADLPERKRARLRNRALGFVFQYHYLLPEFTATENVQMPLIIAGQSRRQSRETARHALKSVGLGHRLGHRPGQLSGGEQQRVAIARALVHAPTVILADEPTGNLDPHLAEDVFGLFKKAVSDQPRAALIVTHNLELARKADRVLRLTDGLINVEGYSQSS